MNAKRARGYSWMVLLFAASAGSAEGAMLYSNTIMVKGSESVKTIELPIEAEGSYRVTMKDLKWFDKESPLLTLGIFTSTEKITTLQGAGTLDFFKAAGTGKVFLQIYARPPGPQFADLIGIQIESQAVVPLPSSILLLSSVLVACALARGRIRRRDDLDSTAAESIAGPVRWLAQPAV